MKLEKAVQVSLLSNENETIISTVPLISQSALANSVVPEAPTTVSDTQTPSNVPEVSCDDKSSTENGNEKSVSENVPKIEKHDSVPTENSSEDDTELDLNLEDSQAQEGKNLTAKQQERLKIRLENQRLRNEEKEKKRIEKEELKKQKQEAIAKKNEANLNKKKEVNEKKLKDEEEFQVQLQEHTEDIKILNDAGFTNNKQNVRLLKKHGNVEKVKDILSKKPKV